MISVFDNEITTGLFGDPEGQAPWAAHRQIEHFVAFEVALTKALARHGLVPAEMARKAALALSNFEADHDDLRTGMQRDGVPVPALVQQMRKHAGEAKDAIHTGATSQDVLDTALVLTFREVTDLVLSRLSEMMSHLDTLIETHGKNTLMGRTRMQAAVQITVADRFEPVRTTLAHLHMQLTTERPRTECLQLGGAVGTNSAFGSGAPAIAKSMSAELTLSPPEHVWHVDRSRVVTFAQTLSLISGTLGKFGQDVALMAQQGIDDIKLTGGGGSSAMPHKSNPVGAELLVTLARFNAAQVGLVHNAMVHEQERSGSAWMLEWMVLPQISSTTCLALKTAIKLCRSINSVGQFPDNQ